MPPPTRPRAVPPRAESHCHDSPAITDALKGFVLKETGVDPDTLLAFIVGTIKRTHEHGCLVVSLIGGEASGKSTLARRIKARLEAEGLKADVICTDDYNVGTREWRWQHFESDIERDLLGKYDFDLMNGKISAIRANADDGVAVSVPTYDEATGLALAVGEERFTHHIGRVDVLIVEGIVQAARCPDLAFYVHTSDDERLQIRIRRDAAVRNISNPKDVIENFDKRQRNLHFPHTVRAVRQSNVFIRTIVGSPFWLYDIYVAAS